MSGTDFVSRDDAAQALMKVIVAAANKAEEKVESTATNTTAQGAAYIDIAKTAAEAFSALY